MKAKDTTAPTGEEYTLTRDEAAKYLEVSTKVIATATARKTLPVVYKHGRYGQTAYYRPADLDQLKAHREATYRKEDATPTQALTRRAGQGVTTKGKPDEKDEPTHTHTLPLAELALRVGVSVDEAAALTGLGPGAIRQAIHTGELYAPEKGPKGARVLSRVAVEAWATAILTPPTKPRRR